MKSGNITHHIEKCLKISKGGALTPTGTATICQIFLIKNAVRFDCQKSIQATTKISKKFCAVSKYALSFKLCNDFNIVLILTGCYILV